MTTEIAPLEGAHAAEPDAGLGTLTTSRGNLPLDAVDVRAAQIPLRGPLRAGQIPLPGLLRDGRVPLRGRTCPETRRGRAEDVRCGRGVRDACDRRQSFVGRARQLGLDLGQRPPFRLTDRKSVV